MSHTINDAARGYVESERFGEVLTAGAAGFHALALDRGLAASPNPVRDALFALELAMDRTQGAISPIPMGSEAEATAALADTIRAALELAGLLKLDVGAAFVAPRAKPEPRKDDVTAPSLSYRRVDPSEYPAFTRAGP